MQVGCDMAALSAGGRAPQGCAVFEAFATVFGRILGASRPRATCRRRFPFPLAASGSCGQRWSAWSRAWTCRWTPLRGLNPKPCPQTLKIRCAVCNAAMRGLDAQVDWDKRIEALLRLEGLIKGGAAQLDGFADALKLMRDPLTAQINDRSVVPPGARHCTLILLCILCWFQRQQVCPLTA